MDNKHHRLNLCSRFRQTNLCDSANKVNFEDVFSDDIAVVKNALNHILGFNQLNLPPHFNTPPHPHGLILYTVYPKIVDSKNSGFTIVETS